MKTSHRYEPLRMPKRPCYQVKQEIDSPYYLPQIHTNDRQWADFHTMSYLEKFCTLESSTMSFSPSHGSPNSYLEDNTSGSCVTEDDANNLRHKIKELETAMLGSEPEALATLGPDSLCLKQVLIDAARAVSDNNLDMAQWWMNLLRGMVSVSGEPIQRLGAYMLEGLVARLASSGSSIYRSLQFNEPETTDLMSYMNILYEACPYFKFGYMSANGAIAEAMKDEKTVHIIDFRIAQGSQWVTLIQAFAARPGGPPRIRITGLEDPTINGKLESVSRRLEKLAKSFHVPFEFIPVLVSGSDVQARDLDVRPGEALAVNFAFVLHRMEDESVSTENHRDRLLRLVKSLSPKVVTLVEQESNTNTAPFFPRFVETLNYYTAMFESMDLTLSRDHKERIHVEQQCLARAVVNIIACEGAERVERHELLGKWRLRFTMAGFRPNPLSPIVNGTIKSLLEKYSFKYRVEEKDGALYLGWIDRDLVASSAWR